MSRQPTTRRNVTGFTLLELMIVMIIMGMVASVAASSASESRQHRLELAQMHIEDAIERARSLASSTRLPHGVAFDPAGNRFAVVREDGTAVTDTLTKREYIIDFDHPNQRLKVSIESADFGEAGAAALFDAQGVPLTGGTLVLDRKGETKTLVFDAATGSLSAP